VHRLAQRDPHNKMEAQSTINELVSPGLSPPAASVRGPFDDSEIDGALGSTKLLNSSSSTPIQVRISTRQCDLNHSMNKPTSARIRASRAERVLRNDVTNAEFGLVYSWRLRDLLSSPRFRQQ
jgi:hypothetical protein